MSESSLKLSGFFNALRTSMSVLFPLITFPYASRVLGPGGIGKVNFASSIVSYFVMIAMLGINNYGIREAGKFRNDKEKLSKFVKEVLLVNLIACLVAYIMLFISIFAFTSLSEYRLLIILSSASILFTVVGLDWLFYAMEDLGSVAVRSFIFQLLSLVLLFAFVKKPDDYIKYAGIGIVSSVGTNIVSFFFARKYVDFKIGVHIELKKHLKPILLFFLMAVAATVNSSIDTTMLGFISGPEQVGYYSAALKVIRLVVAVVTSMTVILPRLSLYYADGELDKFKNLSTRTLNMNILLAWPASLGIILLSKNIIALLSGNMYGASVPVLRVLSLCTLFLALGNLSGGHILLSIGKEKISFYAVLIGIAFNIIINLSLIPKYGALGAGIATLFSEFSVASVEFVFIYKFLVCKSILINLIQCILGSLLMGTAVFFVSKLQLYNPLNVLISIISGVLIYFLLLLLVKNESVNSIIKVRSGRNYEK